MMGTICQCVQGLLSDLRPADADLIHRIDIEEEDLTSAASALNLKPSTLNVRLHRARIALRDALRGHCGDCCEHGFDDGSCPPAGCEHPVERTSCVDDTDGAHAKRQ